MTKSIIVFLLVIASLVFFGCCIFKTGKVKPKEVSRMATLSKTLYGWDSNEIWEMRLSGSWSSIRDMNFGAYPTLDPEATEDAIHAGHDGVNTYTISRVFTGFDFASHGLGTHAIIHSAKIIISGYSLDSAKEIVVCPSSYTPDMAALDQPNTYSSWSEANYGVNDFDWESGDYNTIHLNQTGIDYLNTAMKAEGVCKFAFLDYINDYLDVAPLNGVVNKSGMKFASETVTADKIRLEIEYFAADVNTGSGGSPVRSFTYNDDTLQAEFINNSGTWAQKRAASDATSVSTPSGGSLYFNALDSYLNRSYMKFPFTDFPTGLRAIAGSHVHMIATASGLDDSGETIRLELFEGTYDDRDPDSSTLDMYNDFDTTSFFSKEWDTDGTDYGDDQKWELNAAGLVALNVALVSEEDFKLWVRSHWDIDNETPSNSAYSPYVSVGAYGSGSQWSEPYIELVLGLPITQTDCEAGGWFWYSLGCYDELPTNELDCVSSGGYWYNSQCNSALPTTETECSGYDYYWYYNECQETNKIGVVECQCIDVNNGIWLVAGHEVESIDEVFTSTDTSSEPRLRTTGFTKTPDYTYSGGLDGKIAVITFTDDFPDPNSDSVRCNVHGMKNTSDDLIENPVEMMEHFLSIYMELTSDEYDVTEFGTAETEATDRGYIGAGMIEDTPYAKNIIEGMAKSWDLIPYFTRDGKISVKFIN